MELVLFLCFVSDLCLYVSMFPVESRPILVGYRQVLCEGDSEKSLTLCIERPKEFQSS